MFWPVDQFSCGESSGCSSDAVCMTINKEKTACVCKDGYHGDGKTCDGEVFAPNTLLTVQNTASLIFGCLKVIVVKEGT